MSCLARVDGKSYRLLGLAPSETQKIPLTDFALTPTATEYVFLTEGLQISMRFRSPLLPKHLDLLARPASYVTWEAKSLDGKEHAVQLYFDVTAESAVDQVTQNVTFILFGIRD
jgi:hypothetical protein